MISSRAILLIFLLGLVMSLAVRAPGVWLYDAMARRLRRNQSAPPQSDARAPDASGARAGQLRQPL